MENDIRIQISISKSENGSIDVNTKYAEDVDDNEAVELLTDFISVLKSGEFYFPSPEWQHNSQKLQAYR